jgi:hypothetical protein
MSVSPVRCTLNGNNDAMAAILTSGRRQQKEAFDKQRRIRVPPSCFFQ